MNCQQLQESLGDHSVGTLDAAALSAFEEHLSDCPPCQAAVRQFRRCLALLDHAAHPEPPKELWLGVRSRLDLERSYADHARSHAAAPPPSRWSGVFAGLAGFAAAALIIVNLPGHHDGGIAPTSDTMRQMNTLDMNGPLSNAPAGASVDSFTLLPAPNQGGFTEGLSLPFNKADAPALRRHLGLSGASGR